MKIAISSAASSSHTVKIVNSLAAAGEAVYLYSLPNHRDDDVAIDKAVNIRYLPFGGAKGYYTNALSLRSLLKQDGAEVLNAHYASGYATLARLSGFHPCAVSVWGSDIYDFPKRNPFNRLIIKKNLANADLVMSTSECMAREAAGYVSADKEIVITPFGVDTGAFEPPGERRGGETVRIGTVKSVSEIYGTEYLVRAYDIVRRTAAHDTELHIYGDGELLPSMKRLAAELGTDDSTFFHGRIRHEDVPAVLQELDIFCVPSISESFGVSLIEAMSAGLPSVTSDAPGLKELMLDGITGYIVPAANSELLAERLAELADDAEKRSVMGQNARSHAAARYDWKDNAAVIRQALERLAGARQT